MKYRTDSPRRGWTIVEVMIGVLILAMFVYSIFTVFTRAAKTTDIAGWKAGAQEKMRASMKMLFTDISSATYPSWIYPNKTEVDSGDRWKLSYIEGPIDLNKGAGEGELLKFYICKPGRKNFPQSYGRNIIECLLKLDKHEDGRTRATYSRKVVESNGLEKGTFDNNFSMELFEDIDFIHFEAQKFTDEATADKANKDKIRFKIEFRAANPKYPTTMLPLSQEMVLQVAANGVKKQEEK